MHIRPVLGTKEPMQWELIAIVLAALLVCVGFWFWRSRTKAPSAQVSQEQATAPGSGINGALEKTRGKWWASLTSLAAKRSSELSSAEWESLEEALLVADVSVSATHRMLSALRGRQQDTRSLSEQLESEVLGVLQEAYSPWALPAVQPVVISVVGINGVGKTTTVGKLAQRFTGHGKTVLLGACDTFRAAAVEQLKVWSERAGSQFVSGREGADPAATAFDAVSAGKARGADVVLLDTAGRLHTKTHLMDELKRVHKVIQKVIPEAPHEVWLVVDGTLGQNSLVQAKQFNETLGLTGVIITKLDGTAKGGAVLSLVSELGIPVRFIGVGEKASDLIDFDPAQFAKALLSPV